MFEVIIADLPIHQDEAGRYSLNDLYRASGGADRHRPSKWMRNPQVRELVEHLNLEAHQRASNSVRGHGITGTFVVRELVYAYAMWVSPAFHLQVIRVFDAAMRGGLAQHANYWFARRPHWPAIRTRVLAGQRYREIAAAIGRGAASVANAVRRMIEVGLLSPGSVADAQRGPARLAALRRVPGWGQQLAFEGSDWQGTPPAIAA